MQAAASVVVAAAAVAVLVAAGAAVAATVEATVAEVEAVAVAALSHRIGTTSATVLGKTSGQGAAHRTGRS